MPISVHHRPIDATRTFQLHTWATSGPSFVRDLIETPNGALLDFTLTGVTEPRDLAIQYHSEAAGGKQDIWEAGDYIRLIRRDATELWTFDLTSRVVYTAPGGPTTASNITLHVVTQSRFVGGFIYAWNPYSGGASELFGQTSRDAASNTSNFILPVRSWMAGGFHFKLVSSDKSTWEPESSNRIWVPSDPTEVWLKSGQVSLRNAPLTPVAVNFSVLVPALLTSTPVFEVFDPVDNFGQTLVAASITPAADPLFNLAKYTVSIFPGAAYRVHPLDNKQGESTAIDRPFPRDPANPTAANILLLGHYNWFAAQPVTRTANLQLLPEAGGVFAATPTVAIAVGNAAAYQKPLATLNGASWQVTASVFADIPSSVTWTGSATESTLNLGIDRGRWLTADAASPTYFTAEGVFGFTSSGPIQIADLTTAQRIAIMGDAFGTAVVAAGMFASVELPHGATFSDGNVYFVLFAPHAARVGLVILDTTTNQRKPAMAMSLTADRRYWWCALPAAKAPHGTQYRFALNENLEVLDPAARGIVDSGNFNTSPTDSPANPDTSWSWSRVIDPAFTQQVVTGTNWNTRSWDSLLICELHPFRFTDRNLTGAAGTPPLPGFDQISAECAPGGYLNKLGVTAIELLPVHEYASTNSWGYNPAFYFAVESFYGGPEGLARCVRACHQNGIGVLLDVVYNHTNDTPLNVVAPEVYINGGAYGGLQINFPNDMVKEFLRQAHVYLWTAYRVDGFRLDDTKTMLQNGGWNLLAAMTDALRKAASALGQPWPYQVAENDPKDWDVTNPAFGVMDGQWQINEISNLGHAAYDPRNNSDDHTWDVQNEMGLPERMQRPYYQAVRAGETHDSCGHPENGFENRIAARPPYRQGLQMAKAIGTAAILSNGIPMFFMGAEYGETRSFSLNNGGDVLNPQDGDQPNSDPSRVLAWFRSIIGLRKDPAKHLNGDDNQSISYARRTIAFTRGWTQQIWVCFTFGASNQHPTAGSLGLPDGGYKEIFNSSWPAFAVEFEQEQTNGSYGARIYPGSILNLPYIGGVVLERA